MFSLILERGKETEEQWCEKHGSAATRTCPNGGQTHSLGMCPNWEMNSQRFDEEDNTVTN